MGSWNRFLKTEKISGSDSPGLCQVSSGDLLPRFMQISLEGFLSQKFLTSRSCLLEHLWAAIPFYIARFESMLTCWLEFEMLFLHSLFGRLKIINQHLFISTSWHVVINYICINFLGSLNRETESEVEVRSWLTV